MLGKIGPVLARHASDECCPALSTIVRQFSLGTEIRRSMHVIVPCGDPEQDKAV